MSKKFTLEQQEIIEHYGNGCVNAVAGSGKSSVCVEYARQRPDKNILYWVYNSAMRQEALRKFKGLDHVTVETGHSLAYREMEVGKKYVLRETNNLMVHEIVDLLKLKPDDDMNHLVLARHIINHFNKFLNSGYDRPEDLRYLKDIRDPDARHFVSRHRDQIIAGSLFLFDGMRSGQLPLTHDCYLKMYQLLQPKLPYSSYIIDEGQDTNPTLLDIFLRQKGHKLIVGDTYQSIYSWRGGIDSLEKVDFPRFYMTQSFRFGQNIARMAMRSLKLREWFGYSAPPFEIRGVGGSDKPETTAVIARGNLGLLAEAVTQVAENPQETFCFEGGLQNYSFISQGTSLFDILNLHLNKRDKIRGEFAKQFHNLSEVKHYAKQTDDAEMRLLCGIVERYKGALFPLLMQMKKLQVPRKNAHLIFSSCHRSKGCEYGNVRLLDGFITGKAIKKTIAKANKTGETIDYDAMAEAVNLLYVGITRAKNSVYMGFDIEKGKPEN